MSWTVGGAAFLATAILSFFLTGVARRWLAKARVFARPNARSLHAGLVPRGGGLAILVAAAAGMAVFGGWAG